MSLADFLIGSLFFAVTVGCALAASAVIVRRRLSHLGGEAAMLAGGLLATCGVIAVHLLPGLAGILSRWSAAACAIALLGGAVALAGSRPDSGSGSGSQARRWRPALSVSTALAGLGVGAATLCALTAAWRGTRFASYEIDTTTFHLPNLVKWIQTGSVWRADQFVPLLSNGNYPQNGDLATLAAVLPWNNDMLVRAVGLPFAALAGLSVFALATELGARRSTGALFGALFTCVPVFALSTHEGAKTDPVMLATFGAGLYFLARQVREPRTSNLLLGGLGLGLALGTKWYGLWSAAIVVAVWGGVALLARRPPRAVLRAAVGVTGVIVLAGGVWMLRNLALSGSPLYPSGVTVLGHTVFGVPEDFVRECGGFTIARYFDEPSVLRHFVYPAFRSGYGWPGLALGLGWAAAAALVVRDMLRRAGAARWGVPLLLVAIVPLLALAYSLAPYSAIGLPGQPFAQANLRWLLPAMLPAAALSAWAIGRVPRAAPVLEVLALLALADGIRRGFHFPIRSLVLVAAAVSLLGGAGVTGVRLWRSPRRWGRPAVALGLVAVCALGVVGGHRRQRAFERTRYAGVDPVVTALADRSAPRSKVGLAGVTGAGVASPVFAAFGPGLKNDVSYVGPTHRGQLREYPSRRDFLRAVHRGDYDLLVIGRGTLGYGGCAVPGIETDEDAYAREAGFRLVAQSDRISLYSLR